MTPEELKEIEERCNKATPNPTLTRYDHGGGRSYVSLPSGGVDLVADYYGEGPDREFYYHSREDIPKLLSYIKELESRLPRRFPVEERLPLDNERVLAWVRGFGGMEDVTLLTFRMDGSEEFSPWGTGFYDTECVWVEGVTHWQSLPKEPEE